MKITRSRSLFSLSLLLTATLVSSQARASELISYSSLDVASNSDHRYFILNSLTKQPIFDMYADDLKDVALRDGYAVIQSKFNNFTWINDQGSVLSKGTFGSHFKVNDRLFAVYNPGSNGDVILKNGENLYHNQLQVKSIGITRHSFGVLTNVLGTFELYGLDKKLLHAAWMDIKKATLTENFLVLENSVGQTQILKKNGDETITNEIHIKGLKASDAFVAYIDQSGWLRVYSSSGYHGSFYNTQEYGVSNSFFYVKDQFGYTAYNVGGEQTLSNLPGEHASVSHDLLAVRQNGKSVFVVNGGTGVSFVIQNSDSFLLSDRQVLSKTGTNYSLYSALGSSMGTIVLSEFDSTVTGFVLGQTQVAFNYLVNRGAKAYAPFFNKVGQIRFDALQVDRLDLSVNRDELNWASF